ncbi:hypothetical protein [Clostridium drakei]|uniref:hypothetical protein n=1 Tax=Clostridium drakei TaxID=332101 RepID=UPI00126894D7|nr:hypothetical protein [Clostridium drakei]
MKEHIVNNELNCTMRIIVIETLRETSMVGGGSMPMEKIETYIIKVKSNKFSLQELEKN